MTQDTPTAPVLPPRPNPGPEEWPASSWPPTAWAAIFVAALVGLLVVWWAWRRRRSKKTSQDVDAGAGQDFAIVDPWIHQAERIRAALKDRFGPSWSAKTTEEITSAIAALPGFDLAAMEPLLRLLREADRVKFAGTAAGPTAQGDDAAELVEPVLAAIAAAGASSTSNAK